VKVFVATCLGQGRGRYDVCTTLEGELVALHDCETDCVVCRRAMIGVVSGGDTTTFMAVDRLDIDREMYRTFIRDGLARVGHQQDADESDEVWLDDLVDDLLRLAEESPAGVVLERVDHRWRQRWIPEFGTQPAA
jgi:hypothetical protein